MGHPNGSIRPGHLTDPSDRPSLIAQSDGSISAIRHQTGSSERPICFFIFFWGGFHPAHSPLMNFTFPILASAASRSGARSAPRRTWYPIGRWAVKERGRGGARGGQQARKGQKGDRKSQRTGLTNCKRASSFFSASAPRLRRERRSRTPSRIRGLLVALLAVYAAIFGPAARAWDARRARALGATSAPGPHFLVRTASLLRPQVSTGKSRPHVLLVFPLAFICTTF